MNPNRIKLHGNASTTQYSMGLLRALGQSGIEFTLALIVDYRCHCHYQYHCHHHLCFLYLLSLYSLPPIVWKNKFFKGATINAAILIPWIFYHTVINEENALFWWWPNSLHRHSNQFVPSTERLSLRESTTKHKKQPIVRRTYAHLQVMEDWLQPQCMFMHESYHRFGNDHIAETLPRLRTCRFDQIQIYIRCNEYVKCKWGHWWYETMQIA